MSTMEVVINERENDHYSIDENTPIHGHPVRMRCGGEEQHDKCKEEETQSKSVDRESSSTQVEA